MSDAPLGGFDPQAVVHHHFQVREFYLREGGAYEFRVEPAPNMKAAFARLVRELKPHGYVGVLRKDVDDDLVLYVAPIRIHKSFRLRTPLILLAVTIGTILIDGYLRVSFIAPYYNPYLLVLLYAIGVLGIIGIHEFGHKVATRTHDIRSSLPYFIPGIPGYIPTMGAVITSGEPPVNRDNLFDLGISGPLAGLAVTILVAIGGAITAIALPAEEVQRQLMEGTLQRVYQMDYLNEFLLETFARRPVDTELVLSPLTFASSLGFLITFLNLMPAWQLDGGHIARAVLTRRQHQVATYLSVLILFLLGFQLMAFLILLLSLRSPEMRPLDDVSPLSPGRRIGFFLMMGLAAALYYFTIMNNPFFFPAVEQPITG
jgi:Zn-dependent protease